VYTVSHELSSNGREAEARGIASAIWNYAYSFAGRQSNQLASGDILNAVMSTRPYQYIQAPNHSGWTPQQWYDEGRSNANDALRTNNGDNECERLRGIVNAATSPGAGLPLDYQHWFGVQGRRNFRLSSGQIRIVDTVFTSP
jgi:hypothetical protein